MSKHPLAIQRSLILASYNQLYELVEERKKHSLDYHKQEQDLQRIHLRLIKCQEKCKRFGV